MGKRRGKRRLPEPCACITIESLAYDGRGVAHRDGKAVFIDGALPGESVAFAYLASHRKYDEGRVTAVLHASPDRVEPKCPHFGVCGGCSLQHLAAGAQIMAKQQILLDNLAHIGGVVPERVLAPLTGPVWGYRTRARLGVREVLKKGRVLVGFREKRSALLADLSRCEVLHPAVGEQLAGLAALVGRLEARARIPQLEVAVTDSVTLLVFRTLDPLGAADQSRLTDYAQEHALHIYLQTAGPESVQPLWPDPVTLKYALPLQGIEIEFQPLDFTQINPAINRQMVTRVLELLQIESADRVLDLFCGLGNFTLPVARLAAGVTGVEGDAALVGRARDNARRNGVRNANFHCADLSGRNNEAPWAGRVYEKILLDPPRSGAAAVMDLLGNARPGRIVYVSCHPGSLARDADRLVNEYGYRLSAAGVMDMFPHTAHVESVALFEQDRA
jgi:23S rRNA (uracil1939-C5)-methyltransferase